MTTAGGTPTAADRRGSRRTLPPATALARWPRWLTVAVCVLAWLVALAAVAPLVHGYLTNPPDQRMVDLAVYRTAGQSVLRGQPLYQMLTPPPQMLPFTYPPLAAVLAVPLALLPWSAAQVVWLAFIYLPLAVIVSYAFRPLASRAGPLAPAAFAAAFCLCAYLFPMRDELRFGQVDALLAALAVVDCAAHRPRWPRGALVGFATAVKLMPGVFIVYLWVSGRRRAAVTAATAFVAWTVGTFLVLPAASVQYWTKDIFDSGRLGNNAGTENQSLRGFLLRALPHGHAATAVWLVVVLAVAIPGFYAAARASRNHRELTGVAIVALLEMLVSPVAWIHDFMVVVVVIGVLAGDGRSPRRLAAAAATTAFFYETIPWMGQSLTSQAGVPIVVARVVQGAFGLAAVVLVVLLARLRAVDGARSRDSRLA